MLIRKIGKYTICITDVDILQEKQDENVLVKGCYKTAYIPSVNTQYIVHDSTKTLDPTLVKERKNILSHLSSSGYNRHCIPDDDKLTIEFGFYLNHSINSRDLDNLLKFTIDTMAEYFLFNDNRIYQISCYKRLILNSDKELVHFRIKKSDTGETPIDYRLITSEYL